jgi:N-acetylglucosaminyldiphosphoundecaprenol N-acetyl-beta-D-mannosaminyltransferase
MASEPHEDLVVPADARGGGLDLGRPLEAVLGLPFDALTLDEAVVEVRRCARERRPCFVSTPNVNFAVAAQDDPAFRGSVLRSDLSLADGMPIVWLARWLGLAVPERVSGSDLFARLQREAGEPLKVYFFGAPDGVAERAARALDAQGGGLRCVGFDSPGFGSVEEMSGDERIARINASGADFLVVSLGARKGQAWIERNRSRLAPPVMSHLGAVVNFVAGEVGRAPSAWQRLGLEWLWRIKEEPALWRRYGRDGAMLLRLVAATVGPALGRRLLDRGVGAPALMRAERRAGVRLLRLSGTWTRDATPRLAAEAARALRAGDAVQVDAGEATSLDPRAVAMLMLIEGRQRGAPPVLRHPEALPAAIRRVFGLCGAGYLCEPVSSAFPSGEERREAN